MTCALQEGVPSEVNLEHQTPDQLGVSPAEFIFIFLVNSLPF